MRSTFLLLALLAFATVVRADEKLDTFKSIYSGEMDKIVAQYSSDMEKVGEAYLKQLDAAMKTTISKADLDAYKKLDLEKKRYQTEKTIPKGSAVQDLVAKVDYNKNAAIVALSQKYLSGLNAHMGALMKAQDIASAESVQTEIKKIDAQVASVSKSLPTTSRGPAGTTKPTPAASKPRTNVVGTSQTVLRNIAKDAKPSASSVFSRDGNTSSLVDGSTKSSWVAVRGDKIGSWAKLEWENPVVVKRVVVFDRPNMKDNVQAATVEFSDGTKNQIDALPNDAQSGAEITFNRPKTITWLKVTITAGRFVYAGLSEIEVYGSEKR